MGIGELENKNIYVVCLSIEVITHGENAVEREEGEKIGGLLLFVFSFFQYCVALTLLLLGRSLLVPIG